MSGSGPAGELTMADVRGRLQSLKDRLAAALGDQVQTAGEVAQRRQAVLDEMVEAMQATGGPEQ